MLGVVLLWLLVGLACWLDWQLLRQSCRILVRLEGIEQRLAETAAPAAAPIPLATGLPVGVLAPAFELPDLTGTLQSLAQFRGRTVLLVFFNPACGFCVELAGDLAALPTEGRDGDPVPLIVSGGSVGENQRLVEAAGLRCLFLLDERSEVMSRYQATGTPMGYLIDAQGRIASELTLGAEALLALAAAPQPAPTARAAVPNGGNRSAALGGIRPLGQSKIGRHGLPPGTLAPDFTVPRLEGGELSLAAYRGQRLLLVFSDPHCGPCDQLAPALERQHRTLPAVPVLMVSRGDPETNRAKAAEHGLTFPIGLQRAWEVSRRYATFATPAAYLIDPAGCLASDVVLGVEPILALLATAAALPPAEAEGAHCRCGRGAGDCGCGTVDRASGARRHHRAAHLQGTDEERS